MASSGNRVQSALGCCGELTINGSIHLRARDYSPGTGTFTKRDPRAGIAGTTTLTNPYHYADNDPLDRVDPTGETSTQDCNLNGEGRCPVVVEDASEGFRAGTDEWEVPERRDLDCSVATDSAPEIASVSLALGVDTRLVFGIYAQETTACTTVAGDRAGSHFHHLGSAGASNLPESSFEATVRRNPQRFGFNSASDVTSQWLTDRYDELIYRDGISAYNLAYATASRVLDIYQDLRSAEQQKQVKRIGRSDVPQYAHDHTYRVYRESALVGQAYTSVRNESFQFFVDLFTLGDAGHIDAAGSAAALDDNGESGYSNGFDATCSTKPFRC